MMVQFDRVQHLVRVPVRVGEDGYRFLVDTGIGTTVVSSAAAARAGVRRIGEVTARRMSGQEIVAPLVRLPALIGADYLNRYRHTMGFGGARMFLNPCRGSGSG